MATVPQLVDLRPRDFQLFFSVLGFLGSILFTGLCWCMRIVVRWQIAKWVRDEKRHRTQQQFNDRIIFMFQQAGYILEYPEEKIE